MGKAEASAIRHVAQTTYRCMRLFCRANDPKIDIPSVRTAGKREILNIPLVYVELGPCSPLRQERAVGCNLNCEPIGGLVELLVSARDSLILDVLQYLGPNFPSRKPDALTFRTRGCREPHPNSTAPARYVGRNVADGQPYFAMPRKRERAVK